MKKKVIRKKAGKCKYIVHNDLCDLTKNWARTFDAQGEPLGEYDYLHCTPDNCPFKKKENTNEIVILRVRPPMERVEYAYDKIMAMVNEGKVKLKEKDRPFLLGYLLTIKLAIEELKGESK
jgi:hypothetical protein